MPAVGLGSDQFRELADDIEDFQAELPAAIARGIKWTIDDLKDLIVENIRRKETANGGTLDSRTSPYSPGGTNDSSDDSLHIADKEAWNDRKTNLTQWRVFPDPKVRDRAMYMEYGTKDHGPSGDTPMYFQVNGLTIVMSEADDDASIPEQFDAEPLEVSGVDSQLYFKEAFERLRADGTLKDNIEASLRLAAQENFEL